MRFMTGTVRTVRVAVIDDERSERETVAEYLTRYAQESGMALEVCPYPSGDALLEDYRPGMDILIFDIDMPGISGMDAARQVRAQDPFAVILFLTNMAQYAICGYEVEAVDYILKPVSYYDFALKFRRAVQRATRRRSRELLLDTVEGKVPIQTEDIAYVETMGHYLTYHTVSGRDLRVRGNLREHEQLLRPYGFCQVHKSFLVNLSHVEELRANTVTVAGMSIVVGRAYKSRLTEEYLRFLRA